MTKQEAIETIKTAIARVEWEYPMDYAVAFDMAIEALRQPEIVRCKNCFYGEVEPDDNSYFFCTHPLHKLESHESSCFCADGERRTDDV